MGQIQYSEKYFDDTYEYRYLPFQFLSLFFIFHGFFIFWFPLGYEMRWNLVPDCWYRHVVLPPEVAKLLPKNRLLSEVSN